MPTESNESKGVAIHKRIFFLAMAWRVGRAQGRATGFVVID